MQCDEGFLGFGSMEKFLFFYLISGLATVDAVAIYTIILVLDVLIRFIVLVLIIHFKFFLNGSRDSMLL